MLKKLIKLWNKTAEFHEITVPATDENISKTEQIIKKKFPQDFRELFEYSDGLYLYEGNLKINKLFIEGDELCIRNNLNFHTNCNFPTHKDMIIFGDDGSEAIYSLIAIEELTFYPVIKFTGDTGYKLMNLSFINFLNCTALFYLSMYLVEYPIVAEALKDFGIPGNLIKTNITWDAVLSWGDPVLLNLLQESVYREYSIAEIKEITLRA